MKELFLLIAYCLMAGAAIAAPAMQPRPQTETEISHLLEFVQASNCEFNRNDTWHNGKDARLHLEMKYDALASRGMISTPEDFIEKGASKSSFSGRKYQIRCQDGKTVSSNQWLTEELQRYRLSSSKK